MENITNIILIFLLTVFLLIVGISGVQTAVNNKLGIVTTEEGKVKEISMNSNYEIVMNLSTGVSSIKVSYLRDKKTDIMYYSNSHDKFTYSLDIEGVYYNAERQPMTYSEFKELYDLK